MKAFTFQAPVKIYFGEGGVSAGSVRQLPRTEIFELLKEAVE